MHMDQGHSVVGEGSIKDSLSWLTLDAPEAEVVFEPQAMADNHHYESSSEQYKAV